MLNAHSSTQIEKMLLVWHKCILIQLDSDFPNSDFIVTHENRACAIHAIRNVWHSQAKCTWLLEFPMVTQWTHPKMMCACKPIDWKGSLKFPMRFLWEGWANWLSMPNMTCSAWISQEFFHCQNVSWQSAPQCLQVPLAFCALGAIVWKWDAENGTTKHFQVTLLLNAHTTKWTHFTQSSNWDMSHRSLKVTHSQRCHASETCQTCREVCWEWEG